MNTTDKSSNIIIDYIEQQILAGTLSIGDKLPTERDLAHTLGVSRSTVREGIKLLQMIGIVESRQGSGNYISEHFDRTLEKVLTIAYTLDDMTYDEIQEFRYAVERQALVLAVKNTDEEQKQELRQYLAGMLNGENEEEQLENDRLLHLCIVRMSGNRLVIANYMALNQIIRGSVREARKKVRRQSKKNFERFQSVHRDLVEAILNGDLESGKRALDKHFTYISKGFDT